MNLRDEKDRAEELAHIHGIRYAVVDTHGWLTPYQTVPFTSALEMREQIIYVSGCKVCQG